MTENNLFLTDWGGGGYKTVTELLCRALAVFLSYLGISPIYFLINGIFFYIITDSGNLPSVT